MRCLTNCLIVRQRGFPSGPVQRSHTSGIAQLEFESIFMPHWLLRWDEIDDYHHQNNDSSAICVSSWDEFATRLCDRLPSDHQCRMDPVLPSLSTGVVRQTLMRSGFCLSLKVNLSSGQGGSMPKFQKTVYRNEYQ